MLASDARLPQPHSQFRRILYTLAYRRTARAPSRTSGLCSRAQRMPEPLVPKTPQKHRDKRKTSPRESKVRQYVSILTQDERRWTATTERSLPTQGEESP